MPKVFSGKQVTKVLTKEFGFSVKSQRGSHVKLVKVFSNNEIVTIVPLHRELAKGTLRGILDLAQVDEREFRIIANH